MDTVRCSYRGKNRHSGGKPCRVTVPTQRLSHWVSSTLCLLFSGLQVPWVVGLSEETHGGHFAHGLEFRIYWFPITQFNATHPPNTHTTHLHTCINLISYSWISKVVYLDLHETLFLLEEKEDKLSEKIIISTICIEGFLQMLSFSCSLYFIILTISMKQVMVLLTHFKDKESKVYTRGQQIFSVKGQPES